MLEKGWPWDSAEGDTREYGAQEIADAFTSFIKNGVLDAEGDFLLTPQSGNTLRISSGTAWINGRMLKLDGFEDIEIPYVAASEMPRYGVLGLLLRPDVDHRDFTFFYMPPNGDELPALGENEIAIAKIRYDRGTPAITADHIIRDVERAYTTNPYYDKKGITMEFLNEVVSSYMEFTPEGIAIYDGPASDTGRKMVFGYDVVEKALKMVGDITAETTVGDVEYKANLNNFMHDLNRTGTKVKCLGLKVFEPGNDTNFLALGATVQEDRLGCAFLNGANTVYIIADPADIVGLTSGSKVIIRADGTSGTQCYVSVDNYVMSHQSYKGIRFSTAGGYFRVDGNDIWHQGNLKIASGTIGITPGASGTSTKVTVDISGYGFTEIPSVFASPQSSGVGKVFTTATNTTTTSFEIYGTRNDGGGGFSCSWLAIGT